MTPGPNRSTSERTGALQHKLDDARDLLAALAQGLQRLASQHTSAHARQMLERMSRRVGEAESLVRADTGMPRWLPGLPIGADQQAEPRQVGGLEE